MGEKNNGRALPEGREAVSLTFRTHVGYRAFSALLILCALLVASFGVGALWVQMRRADEPLQNGTAAQTGEGSFGERTSQESEESADPVPGGATRILSMDLSGREHGEDYLHNQTPYRPDVRELSKCLPVDLLAIDEISVLILHTHTSESYLEEQCDFVEGELGDVTYSRNEEKNVLAVGKALCEALKKKGITALHCTVMHDDPTLSGSYERAAQTIRKYQEEYPNISCVIDLHRDAILTPGGEYVRTLATGTEEATAQIMAVVGSDCNGTSHARWKENLALALHLRRLCEQSYPTLFRPVSLRTASYNQELAPYFLLLEIGSGGNSVEEAIRAAELFAEVFAQLLNGHGDP